MRDGKSWQDGESIGFSGCASQLATQPSGVRLPAIPQLKTATCCKKDIMAWDKDKQIYFYTSGVLRAVASCYVNLYEDGLIFRDDKALRDVWALADYRADFDVALSSLGKRFEYLGAPLKDYHGYNDLQLSVISDIVYGVLDEQIRDYAMEKDLTSLGKRYIIYMRGGAYRLMCKYLNGGKNE